MHGWFFRGNNFPGLRAQAEASLAESQCAELSAMREKARLDARTREADAAEGQVARVPGAVSRK